jgi:transcription initiation factor TFIID subunit 1
MPDQEKAFRAPALVGKVGDEYASRPGLISLSSGLKDQDDSDDDLALSTIEEDERIGGVTMQDLAIICGDWDIPSSDAASVSEDVVLDGDWDATELRRPNKRRRILESDLSLSLQDPQIPFEDPERATAKLARSVALDLNDQNLLVDELLPQRKRKAVRDTRRNGAVTRSVARRYNISNDEDYDLLKENHQHKVRSTLGAMAIEHSLPATKLQFPFYRVNLDGKAKRAFHRPSFDVVNGRSREWRFTKMKHVKRKNIRGKEAKELFARAEDLSLCDNSNILLLEYSEEAPIMMSNFGMGSKLLNYYRKRDADDQERPKREIGETNVLLTQDKSPFANFGHVDKGEIVPTIHNGMYRAPVFQHKAKPTDFVVGLSSSNGSGNRFYIRNVENLHTVGQQLPTAEVPTKHSRRVTDAAKKRLRALSYRMYSKSVDPGHPRAKPLNNENLMPHLPNHDMPQTRSKMREFMKYERAPGKDSGGVWVPHPGQVVPDAETLRSWIKPEDVCLLDSMQAGVQHLQDLGITDDGKNDEDDKDLDENEHIEKQLAPWRATKNFLHATQGKAMLKLYGDGDPTGRGEGYSFVKTSMKGGFASHGESANDKMLAKKRRETGGHSYNVAEQQRLYDDSIREIWNKQKQSLSAENEHSDVEMGDDHDEPTSAYPSGRGATPRSSFPTPGAPSRYEDESASQFSRGSAGRRGDQILVITRRTVDKWGEPQVITEEVTNQKVIQQYNKKQQEKKIQQLSYACSLLLPLSSTLLTTLPSHNDMNPTGDAEFDALKRQELERELARLSRNQERRVAREKQKGITNPGSPSAAASPGQSDTGDGTTPQKGGTGRGRNKDGTARKCANCGQVGHIKTNRKSVSFNCVFCGPADFVPLDYFLAVEASRGGSATATPGTANSRKQGSRVSGTAVHASSTNGAVLPRGGELSAAFNYSKFEL